MRPRPIRRAGRAESAAGSLVRELFEEHARMVYGVCRLMLRNAHEAEDAAQQTFLSAYDSILKGRTPEDPAPWLATIARNECRARIRRERPEPLMLVEDMASNADPAGASMQREEAAALAAVIAELPSHQRHALVLREFYGLSYEEVGAALGVSQAAVESLLWRGRQKVHDRLRPFRAAAGALTVPLGLREALGANLPGFAPEAGAAAGGGLAAIVAAKLASVPAAAKVGAAVAATAAMGAGTYSAVNEPPAPARSPAVGTTPAPAIPGVGERGRLPISLPPIGDDDDEFDVEEDEDDGEQLEADEDEQPDHDEDELEDELVDELEDELEDAFEVEEVEEVED